MTATTIYLDLLNNRKWAKVTQTGCLPSIWQVKYAISQYGEIKEICIEFYNAEIGFAEKMTKPKELINAIRKQLKSGSVFQMIENPYKTILND